MRSGSVLLIRMPYASPSVHYRAYEACLESETVLEWTIRRLRSMSPRGCRLICVCDTASERERLRAAYRLADPLDVVALTLSNEAHVCKWVMEHYDVRRLTVAGLVHAIAPDRWLDSLRQLHEIAGAELTTPDGSIYAQSSCVIESSLANLILVSSLPDMPVTIMGAASLLKRAIVARSPLVRDFRWTRVNLATHLCIAPGRWPENVALESARDVGVLRRVLAVQKGAGDGWYVDRWKEAVISIRQKRFAPRSRSARSKTRRGRRIRVLYAADPPAFTGAQQSLCHLVGALDRCRYEPVALLSHSGTFSDELRRRHVHVVIPEERINKGDPENVLFAKRVLADYRPDIIHANHGMGMPLTVAALMLGTPIVQHVRVQNPEGLREQIYAADAVIAVSHFVRERVIGLDVDPRKVEVVWNGVDTREFAPARSQKLFWRRHFGLPEGELIVTMIARMARNKRHDLVIDALQRVRELLGRGHLVIVGAFDGDRAYQDATTAHVGRCGMAGHYSRFEFLADVRPILHASDIVTLPSEDEPLSRAVLEAMALGLPVLVSDSGGTKEVIEAGRTGIVVRHGDVSSLRAALLQLATSPETAEAMGIAAAAEVSTSLTSARCAERTTEIYERVLAGEYARRTDA